MIQLSIILLLIFVIFVAVGVIFLTYWPVYGAPFVPTAKGEIKEIFKKINLKKEQLFCDLGCGDGRMVKAAVKITKTKAIGLDINWGLIQWCKLTGIPNTKYYCQNILKSELPKADVYFVYFWPGGVDEIVKKLISYKVKCLIVSKSFEVKNYKSNRTFEVNGSRFWVYSIAPKAPK